MSAFDVITRTIHDDDWAEGEEVIIKEPTYGENLKMVRACTRKDGELDNLKYTDMLLPIAIVSWTFQRDDEDVPANLENIKQLPTSYVAFITEQIGEFMPEIDAEFPNES